MKALSCIVTVVLVSLPLGHRVSGQPITFGEVTFRLGMNAFSEHAQCLDPGIACNSGLPFYGPYPYPRLPWNGGLTGEFLGEVVVDYATDQGDIRLVFSTPVRNRNGPDLYLAEADFNLFGINGGLGDFAIKFRDEVAWHTIIESDFVLDSTGGDILTVGIGDYLWGARYDIWYHLLDLSDYGFAPGDVVRELNIRGPSVGAIHILTVASLNWPPVGDVDLDADVDLDDWGVMSGAFGTCQGDQAYNATADFNQSGCVDLFDFFVFQRRFGAGVLPPPGPSISGRITNGAGSYYSFGGVLFVTGPLPTAVGCVEIIHNQEWKFEVPDLPDGVYTIRPQLDQHLYLPTKATVTVSGTDVTGVDFTSYYVSGTLVEYEGNIIAIDPAAQSFTVDKLGVQTTLWPHIAAVYEGQALSFGELELGMKAMGTYYYAGSVATLVKTEWP